MFKETLIKSKLPPPQAGEGWGEGEKSSTCPSPQPSPTRGEGVNQRLLKHHFFKLDFLLIYTLLLSGCAVTPDTIVKQPLTAKPAIASPAKASNGAIFNTASYHPLFEDNRPRYVGDIVTINITENTSATKAGESSGSKDGKANNAVTSLFGFNAPKASFAGTSSNSFKDKADETASNVFTGAITATVVEVLPNGYLVVSGEKQVSLDKGTEFVRFSGVVNPDTITVGNFVTSNKVADARIEYRTNSKIDIAGVTSMLARFFLSLGPL